ncbi:MAG: hypothetical protein M1834_006649 [Cirrosporium novae-zelandiae]|nr:MAG: hypothetical protein M1834_006649 [Cirrosporium novae-zelandiae]
MSTMEDPLNLVPKIQSYVLAYMSQFDPSHGYAHIQRVVALAKQIAAQELILHPSTSYNHLVIHLAALLHDIGDKKYLKPGEDPTTMVFNLLQLHGASTALGSRVQSIVSHVSFSSEIASPTAVKTCLDQNPELAIVQDADRLDAIGAVGIGRCFTFTGAKRRDDGMEGAIRHFEEKLERLEGMMKTDTGRRLARERTERLRIFRGWWEEETGRGVEVR